MPNTFFSPKNFALYMKYSTAREAIDDCRYYGAKNV
jgi:hypothetical protein